MFLFLEILFIQETGEDPGRGRSRLHAGSPTWDSIPGSRPEPKADAQPLSTPRRQRLGFSWWVYVCVQTAKPLHPPLGAESAGRPRGRGSWQRPALQLCFLCCFSVHLCPEAGAGGPGLAQRGGQRSVGPKPQEEARLPSDSTQGCLLLSTE